MKLELHFFARVQPIGRKPQSDLVLALLLLKRVADGRALACDRQNQAARRWMREVATICIF